MPSTTSIPPVVAQSFTTQVSTTLTFPATGATFPMLPPLTPESAADVLIVNNGDFAVRIVAAAVHFDAILQNVSAQEVPGHSAVLFLASEPVSTAQQISIHPTLGSANTIEVHRGTATATIDVQTGAPIWRFGT